MHRTCGEPDEIKKNTHPKNITALLRDQAIGNELYGQGTDLIPGANRLDGSQKLANCTKGSGVAASKIGVPALLSPENLANPACDENSIVTYLNMFRKASKPEGEDDDEGDMGFGADAPTTVNVVHPDGRTIVVEAGADDTTLVVKARARS